MYFGMSKRCQVRAGNVRLTKGRHMRFTVDKEEYELPMPGMHFVYSALAAIAVAQQFGVGRDSIRAAFALMRPEPMRGTIEEKAGKTFIVDCYNANPSSMKSGITLLSEVAGKKPKVAIVGDMLELGKFSGRLHTALGRQLAAARVERILAVGEFSDAVAKGAMAGGVERKNIITAKNSEAAVPLAQTMLKSGDTVLLKGSRGIHLETVYQGLARRRTPARHAASVLSEVVHSETGRRDRRCKKRHRRGEISETQRRQRIYQRHLLKRKTGQTACRKRPGGHQPRSGQTHRCGAGKRRHRFIARRCVGHPHPPKGEKPRHSGMVGDRACLPVYRSAIPGRHRLVREKHHHKPARRRHGGGGRQHAVAGNIGIPLVNVVETLPADAFVVAEISSFQLENIDLFRPRPPRCSIS